MKEQFRIKKFGNKSLSTLNAARKVILEYDRLGIRLTLRQLYYQLVSLNHIPNNVKQYQRLSALMTEARYCGLIDWYSIEDRTRKPMMPSEFEDIEELASAAIDSYRLDRWEGQEYYVELFTEKDALTSVLRPIAHTHHIRFCVNRGYTSASSLYEVYKRVQQQLDMDKKVVLLYLGDHDPSGLDMVRDIKERLIEMLSGGIEHGYEKGDGEISENNFESLEVRHIALTSEQVLEYRPPPNPAKFQDPRAKKYIAQFGRNSWEVDALKPEVMIKLVNDSISSYIDEKKLIKILKKEQDDIVAFKKKLNIK